MSRTDTLRQQILFSAPLGAHDPNAGAKAVLIIGVIALGLVLDSRGSPLLHLAASVPVWLTLLWLLHQQTPAWRLTLVVATAFALAAEALFSLGWGLYDYRFHDIPAYVPPAHTLLFMVGVYCGRKLPARLVPLLLLILVAGALWMTISGASRFDGLMLLILLALARYGSQPRIYILMVPIALMVELGGTELGEWRWQREAPGLGLSLHNPPLLAGVCYSLFDVYMMRTARWFHRWRGAPSSLSDAGAAAPQA